MCDLVRGLVASWRASQRTHMLALLVAESFANGQHGGR